MTATAACVRTSVRYRLVRMAGGMHSARGPGVPLYLRGGTHVHDFPVKQQVSRRHCWVRSPDGQLYEGLVLTWRREPTGWTAHVTYLHEDRAITAWIPAEHLSPA